MICQHCGNTVRDGAAFCPACGKSTAPVGAAPAVQSAATNTTKPAIAKGGFIAAIILSVGSLLCFLLSQSISVISGFISSGFLSSPDLFLQTHVQELIMLVFFYTAFIILCCSLRKLPAFTAVLPFIASILCYIVFGLIRSSPSWSVWLGISIDIVCAALCLVFLILSRFRTINGLRIGATIGFALHALFSFTMMTVSLINIYNQLAYFDMGTVIQLAVTWIISELAFVLHYAALIIIMFSVKQTKNP